MKSKQFRCAGGESWDSIARMLYGDETKSVELMKINPTKCLISVFEGGEVIDLPDDREITFGQQQTAAAVYPAANAPWRE